MSRLVVTDVDSTLIRDEVIELIADALGSAARKHVADVTERAMRGEIDFATSLAERVTMLAGAPASVFADVAEQVRVTDGVVEFIAELHEQGGAIAAVSGGFHEVLDPLAKRLGIDFALANRLEVVDDRLTGRTVGPVIDAAAKRDALQRFAIERGVDTQSVIAVGDGANDLLMLQAAGTSVAFCAKPVVQAQATVVIDEPDFRLLLPLL